jgi:hypothetical protein
MSDPFETTPARGIHPEETRRNLEKKRLEEGRALRAQEAKWLVLRCEGKLTLDLEDLLVREGLRAWSPRYWLRKRLPRKKVRIWVETALTPSFVFLRGEDLEWACNVRDDSGVSGHRVTDQGKPVLFRPSKNQGSLLQVFDWELGPLRAYDQREYPGIVPSQAPVVEEEPNPVYVAENPPELVPPHDFQVHQTVRVKEGLFTDLIGTVETINADGGITIAIKKSSLKLTFFSFHLDPI